MPLERIKAHYQKVRTAYKQYEHWLMPVLIVTGFIHHYLTFTIVPVTEALYLVFGYFTVATLAILFVHFYDAGKITERLQYVRLFMPLVLQFCFGSIIGGVFIFYWFSGSIFASWPFIVLMLGFIIAIETFKHHLENPTVQFSLYQFSSFLLLAVALPYFFNSISPWLFLLAGGTSVLLLLVLLLLVRKAPALHGRIMTIMIASMVIVGVMNGLYFYNFIPPVPLSIRDAGAYHSVRRSDSDYIVASEPHNFWQRLDLIPTLHLGPEERAYVFSSIYTPTDLDIDIVHDWQHYDDKTQQWVSVSKLSFPISGGRQSGYRGYSYKNSVPGGKWRVYIETPRGQVLGRVRFDIERVDAVPELEDIIK